MAEEEQIRKEKEKDYLAPFLARIGDPAQLTPSQKESVREDCLQDLRTGLVEVANIIQTRFEKVGLPPICPIPNQTRPALHRKPMSSRVSRRGTNRTRLL